MREKKAKKATSISFVINTILTIAKIITGIIGKSGAMIADGIHSLSDLITDVIVFISIHMSSKPADEDHNYGHGKYETLATFIVGVALFIAGFNIFKDGGTNIINYIKGEPLSIPTSIVLYVALASVIIKEILYRYTIKVGKEINSDAVIANAYHQRSDALSSLGVLISTAIIYIFGSKLVFLDAIAQIVVSLFLFKAAISILKPSLNQLTESSLCEENLHKIKSILEDNEYVLNYHHLRSRKIGSHFALDVHILVDPSLTVVASHDITVDIEQKVREVLDKDALISVHVEPYVQ